jgi:uncharacterized protein
MEKDKEESRKTLLVGATTNPSRYAFVAAKEILDLRAKPELKDIHTITLYIGPANQAEWIDYLIGLNPKRIIFNPGTENPDFFRKASNAGIEVLSACNLVMLSTGQF